MARKKKQPSIFIGIEAPEPPRTLPPTFYLWAALALFVVGGELTWFNGSIVWREARATSWPTADARITSSSISTDSTEFGSGWFRGPRVEERFHVAYAYAVLGTDYTGTRIGMRPSEARVGPQRDRFAVGRTLPVRYDPSDPVDSVIDARVPPMNAVGAGIGLVVLALCIASYRKYLRVSRADSAELSDL